MGKEALISLLKESITARDFTSLAEQLDKFIELLGKEQAHYNLRTKILLSLSLKDQEWFWRSSMSKSKYLRMTELIYSTSLRHLVKRGYVPGSSFSSRMTQSGRRLLLVSSDVLSVLRDALPKERHSALNLVLKVPKEVKVNDCTQSSSDSIH